MQIEVTQKDIDEGQPGRCLHCPVARAMGRAFNIFPRPDGAVSTQAGGVIAGRSQIKVRQVFQMHDFDTPPAAQTFMRKFDNKETVFPFVFEIEAFKIEAFEIEALDTAQTPKEAD